MSAFTATVLQLLFPQRTVCHVCGAPLCGGESLLCEECGRALALDSLAPDYGVTAPRHTVVFAAFAYQGAAAALVKALKFGSDQTAALPLACGMAAAYAALVPLHGAELCVAVPVHSKRLRRRGYNQAAVLAAAFAEITGVPFLPGALIRTHHKPSQVGQGRDARRRNVAGAFTVTGQGARAVAGCRVLLIDDVLTTGATVEECAGALKTAGAGSVAVLTAAFSR